MLITVQNIMAATINHEKVQAEEDKQQGLWEVFRGRNLLRFLIAAWPKVTQQLVGLTVFNTFSTYFCETSLPISDTGILTLEKSRQRGTKIHS